MKIANGLEIVKRVNGDYVLTVNTLPDTPTFTEKDIAELYENCKGLPEFEKINTLNAFLNSMTENATAPVSKTATPMKSAEEILLDEIEHIMDFFKEFQFEPNFRFINTFSRCIQKSKKMGVEYITNYFELIDSPYITEIKSKVNSKEFELIIKGFKGVKPEKEVNQRFKLYYGSQGTGKTTIAMKETDNRCMVCNSSMLPSDLMEDFTFDEGKATFKPSALWECMKNGNAIVLDEINLLPFDSLRFLQTILDGKKEFLYKGTKVEIADGFQIIGTMNLTVNGMTYALPEPLVDRCAETKKFSLSAKDLLSAIM